MSLLDTLIEMGFPKEKAEKALGNTGGKDLEDAINWIISHPDDDGTAPAASDGHVILSTANVGSPKQEEQSTVEIVMDEAPAAAATAPKPPAPQEVRSLKCEDCGKQFRSEDEVQFHAVKSGHTNFSESTDEVKPLSEEEKRSRMLALQERLKQKRMEKEEEEKKKAIEMEKQRRTTGQQIQATKQRIEEEEMKKIAEEKKRQKIEDALAKKRILEQIKLDREAKKQQQGGVSASEAPKPAAPAAAAAPTPAPDSTAQAKKTYDHCQLQIRHLNGTVLKQSFGAKEPLSAVRLYVQMQSGDLKESFTFMTNFPKRVFNDEDMESPLSELGLVPSAVLIMTRKA